MDPDNQTDNQIAQTGVEKPKLSFESCSKLASRVNSEQCSGRKMSNIMVIALSDDDH